MTTNLLKRSAEGALAGVAGTLALQVVMLAHQQFLPQVETPEAEDPASFMLWQVEKRLPRETWMAIPAKVETAAGIGLSLGYGATFGAVYGALRPSTTCGFVEGAALGLAVWAVGYLGWLPAAGLIPPLWKQTPTQMVGPIVEHITYGLITVAAYELIKNRWEPEQLS